MNGYKIEIGALQYRHEPRNIIHEIRGIRSYHAMMVRQEGQKDRSVKIRSL